MRGSEHYGMAEALLEAVHGKDLTGGDLAYVVARAQVHATLALAAATAHPAERDGGYDLTKYGGQ